MWNRDYSVLSATTHEFCVNVVTKFCLIKTENSLQTERKWRLFSTFPAQNSSKACNRSLHFLFYHEVPTEDQHMFLD